MKGYIYSINKSLASFTFINDTDEKKDSFGNDWSHYPIYHRLINFMRDRGFEIEVDKTVHKIIRRGRFRGYKGDLKFRSERYPRGFKVEFYQEKSLEGKCSGEYDFDKFEKMPYLMKLTWINETKKMGNFLKSLEFGIIDGTEPMYKNSQEKIKHNFVKCWHHPQNNMNFKLSDLDGTTCEGSYNNTDRDKKTIYNGQIKYFRHWNGRLMRGKVYHNINNMWWVILNDTERRNIADFELFDVTEEDFKTRRKVKDRKPQEYVDRIKKINDTSTKELINELKRRGVKVAV